MTAADSASIDRQRRELLERLRLQREHLSETLPPEREPEGEGGTGVGGAFPRSQTMRMLMGDAALAGAVSSVLLPMLFRRLPALKQLLRLAPVLVGAVKIGYAVANRRRAVAMPSAAQAAPQAHLAAAPVVNQPP
jgi:hypothetical protein